MSLGPHSRLPWAQGLNDLPFSLHPLPPQEDFSSSSPFMAVASYPGHSWCPQDSANEVLSTAATRGSLTRPLAR